MLKVRKNEYINEGQIECICSYTSEPVYRLVRIGRKNESIRELRGKFGYKSLIIMNDGYLFLCPNNPDVYFSKLDLSEYLVIDSKRILIKKDRIREISTKPNVGQHKEIVKAKAESRYINLSGNKKIRYYIFTTSGRIYGVNLIRKAPDVLE